MADDSLKNRIKVLLDEARYEEALKLLQSSEPSAEVDELKKEVEQKQHAYQMSLSAIRDYYNENSSKYTHSAILNKLRSAGYSTDEINAAIAMYDLQHPPMIGEAQQEKLIELVAKYRGKLSRADLTRTLVREGYSKEDIDDAYMEMLNNRAYQQEVHAHPLGFLLFLPIIPAVIWLVGTITPELALLFVLASLILGIILPRRLRQTNPDMAKGMLYGFRTSLVIFVLLPFVAGVVIFGICMTSGEF